MKCINCIDQFGFKRKCCGSIDITDTERANLNSLGYTDNDYFYLTNSGWHTKLKVVGQTPEGGTVSRCMFLATDEKCEIHLNKGFQHKPAVCKEYPRTDFESQNCGEGNYEGTGYDI